MCFGGSDNSAKKALKYQKKQAADAAAKEAERKARLEAGTKQINGIFDGTPVTAPVDTEYDWSGFNDAAASASAPTSPTGGKLSIGGITTPGTGTRPAVTDQGTLAAAMKGALAKSGTGIKLPAGPGNDPFKGVTIPDGYKVVKGKGGYTLVGPDGTVYKPGDKLTYQTQKDTGQRTGGFGQDFYDKYKNAALDYYNPELAKQYKKATDSLTYDHARAGTLTSTMAGQNLADLVYQNDMNQSQILSKVDNAVGDLHNSVAAQKAAAINQLYATEDPGLAANTATNSVGVLKNTTPEFSALGELFKNAVVGASGFSSAYNDYSNWGSPPGSGSAGHTVN